MGIPCTRCLEARSVQATGGGGGEDQHDAGTSTSAMQTVECAAADKDIKSQARGTPSPTTKKN